MLTIGEKIPDFELKNQDDETVQLKKMRGKKIIIFAYPKAATGGCTTQACGFAEQYPIISDSNAIVLGISPDPVEKLKKWKEKKEFPFDLLSDPDHTVLESWGAWGLKKLYGREYQGVIRSHWVIDADGILLDQQIKVSPKNSVELGVEKVKGS